MPRHALALRGLFGLSLGLIVLSVAPASQAKGKTASANSAPEKKKVLVGAFTGPKSDPARKAVIAALKADGSYDVTEATGVKPGADDASYAKASSGAAAVIVGTVSKSGLVLSIHSGADGALVQDVEVKGSPAKLENNISDSLGLSVADPIARTKAAENPVEASKDEAPAQADEAEKPAEESSEPAAEGAPEATGPTPLELMGGLRAVHRSFSFHDTPLDRFPTRTTLFKAPSYILPLGPAFFIDATVYPFAFGSRGASAMFGITGAYELGFATKSVYGTPEKSLTTRSGQYYIGLKVRIPVAAHEIGLVGAYGQQVFNLRGDEAAPQAPDFTYSFVRLSADPRFRFDDFSLGLHLGTRLVSSTGSLERDPIWFPNHVKTQSLEAGISAGYNLTRGLELVLGFDLLRYAFDFNPQPANADPYTRVVAGGAVDQYTTAWMGLRFSLASHAGP